MQRLEHDEFGRVLFDSNPGLQTFGFAGGLVDSDTGLVRFGARDYEPIVGRWTARDPVRLVAGVNRYEYSRNSPISVRDPQGLKPLWRKILGGLLEQILPGPSACMSEADFEALNP